VTWQAASVIVLAGVLVAGFAWYERDEPPARVVALVATLAALAVVGRLAFAAVPNVKPTTDIVLFAGYALGAVPGFAVGAVTALVSNVFLSQGPWTPWQMVGWGAVGVVGALLARVLRDREPGRLVLAAVCGLAGLAFGAWMDLYQLTLAARQDLDTYLALSASSLPYNLAHAIGNVVFCLLIGPIFIRALRRYRQRFQVRWAAPAAAGGVLLALVLAPTAAASVPTPAQAAERWLLRAQNDDGGFGASRGQASSPLYSGWSGLALAVAGHNPRDLQRAGGRTLASYLERSAGSIREIGEIERTVLLLEAAGLSPRRFAGRDLVAAILARRRADGSISGYVSYTAFGILALRAAGEPAGGSTVSWLTKAQREDGGFGLVPSASSDSDMTGAALQALAAVGRGGNPAARRAVDWLRDNQNDDGGFGQFRGRDSNAQSTSYAVQGLVAVDAGGAVVSRALAYLRGLQRSDGSVAYSSTSRQTPVWVTAQALMALERTPLPVATVPRSRPAEDTAGGGSGGAEAPAAGGGGDADSPAAETAPESPSAPSGAADSGAAAGAADGGATAPGAARDPAGAAGQPGGDAGQGIPGEEEGVLPGDGTPTPRPSAEDEAAAQSAIRAAEDAGDEGVPVGLIAAAVAAAIALLALLLRRRAPERLRRLAGRVVPPPVRRFAGRLVPAPVRRFAGRLVPRTLHRLLPERLRRFLPERFRRPPDAVT
jgi:ECF-type transporter family protein/squalene-hopene cyclase-like protein/prenyltransferase/squalene oxidase-like repeat protein